MAMKNPAQAPQSHDVGDGQNMRDIVFAVQKAFSEDDPAAALCFPALQTPTYAAEQVTFSNDIHVPQAPEYLAVQKSFSGNLPTPWSSGYSPVQRTFSDDMPMMQIPEHLQAQKMFSGDLPTPRIPDYQTMQRQFSDDSPTFLPSARRRAVEELVEYGEVLVRTAVAVACPPPVPHAGDSRSAAGFADAVVAETLAGLRPPPGLPSPPGLSPPPGLALTPASQPSALRRLPAAGPACMAVASAAHHHEAAVKPKPQPEPTTLMVRNIPIDYTQEMLMEEWPNSGSYDFLYLPRNSTGEANLSYAFVNFTSKASALEFVSRWQKQRLPLFQHRKALNISIADVQGFWQNIQQIREKCVRKIWKRRCQPFVVLNGHPISFQEICHRIDSGRASRSSR